MYSRVVTPIMQRSAWQHKAYRGCDARRDGLRQRITWAGTTAGSALQWRHMRATLLWVALALATNGGPAKARDQRKPAPASPAPAAGNACKISALPLRLPAPRRLVAIGDLHGDLAATRAALRAAGAIDERDRWVGGKLVIVQTGDVLDRGDDEQAILDLIARLEPQARAAGGAFIALMGNHELMNGALDFRYVTPAGFHDFDAPGAAPKVSADVPEAARSRVAALGAGGSYARKLAQHAVVAIVGDSVFSHAGIEASWADRLREANQAARCWMDGQTKTVAAALTSDDSPVWTRRVGTSNVDCAQVAATLQRLKVKRMVVGHTVQKDGITSACDGTVWRIDVGMSRHYGGPIEVLELTPDAPPKVLKGTRDP